MQKCSFHQIAAERFLIKASANAFQDDSQDFFIRLNQASLVAEFLDVAHIRKTGWVAKKRNVDIDGLLLHRIAKA